ncbi:MAG: hypothetical protein IPL47_10195 [Phyllobacteriaceae bacterium]|nr:hypothetical protein [Phyllobacteriaceae bacterium]
MRAPAFLFAAALFSAGPAFAGPIADFNAEMTAVYAQYRMVLFKTNQGDQPASAKLAGDFAAGWKARRTLARDAAAAPLRGRGVGQDA